MGATLVWGKGFRFEGDPPEIFGIDGDAEMISWSSVREVQALAEAHGVSREAWPVYPNCEVDSKVPVDDAKRRSDELRVALAQLDASLVENNYWLRFIWKILREGNSFFIML